MSPIVRRKSSPKRKTARYKATRWSSAALALAVEKALVFWEFGRDSDHAARSVEASTITGVHVGLGSGDAIGRGKEAAGFRRDADSSRKWRTI